VLCAVREGPLGVEALNREVEAALVQSGSLPPAPRGIAGVAAGRPILVNRNAPHLGLYNGDVGITDLSGRSRAFFDAGAGDAGSLRSFGIARLPAHELVFAMTVHKSQGSEFDEVVLVLPDEPIPLLTRELVYTAITRARDKVILHARPEVLAAAVARRTTRASGLRDALWGLPR
jgi:exodeoxyribonuclease V alpha subunit